MAEETSVSVSLEDLEKAAEGVFDEKTPEEPPADETEKPAETITVQEELKAEEIIQEEEPIDHKDRSKMGRRLSALESSVQGFIEEMRNTLLKEKEKDIDPEEEVYLDEPLTKRDLDNLLEQREIKIRQSENKYVSDYNAQFEIFRLDSKDQKLHNEIMKEMLANHNIKRSGDGLNDAKWNYMNAKIAVLEKDFPSTPKNPLDKNKDKDLKNLGTPSETKNDKVVSTSKIIKLDDDIREFIEFARSQEGGDSWTDEKVQSILNREPRSKNVRNKK